MAQPAAPKRRWSGWLVLVCLLAAAAAVFWFVRRPLQVVVTHPKLVPLTETIASSARVGGVQESAVGAHFSGTVAQLFVRAGDRVTEGQKLAVLRNDVTRQQKAQAQTAVQTARARLAQVSRAPTRSEMDEAQHQVTEARAQAEQANADLRLATKQFKRIKQMAIIRALANQPKIVLADEPTGNLDSRSGDEVFNIMREMNRENGVAFIMVTHDDRLAQEADRILMIEDGWVHQVDKYEHRRKLLSSLKEG